MIRQKKSILKLHGLTDVEFDWTKKIRGYRCAISPIFKRFKTVLKLKTCLEQVFNGETRT